MQLDEVPRIESLTDATVAALLMSAPARILLLANNQRIRPEALARLPLGPETLLVQFNNPRFDGVLAGQSCQRAYLCTNHDGRFFGFGSDGHPLQPLLDHPGPPLFLFCGRDLTHVAPFLASLPAGVRCLQVPDKRRLLPNYPRGRGPSTGFVAVSLLLALNQRRRAAGQPALPIELVGFTGFARGAFALHDWWYEQRWLRRQPGLLLNPAGARQRSQPWRALGWWISHWRSRLRGWVAALRRKD